MDSTRTLARKQKPLSVVLPFESSTGNILALQRDCSGCYSMTALFKDAMPRFYWYLLLDAFVKEMLFQTPTRSGVSRPSFHKTETRTDMSKDCVLCSYSSIDRSRIRFADHGHHIRVVRPGKALL